MRTGAFLSVSLHTALAALALFAWPREFKEPADEANLVQVDLIEIGPETNIRAQVKAPEPKPDPLPEPAEVKPPEPEPLPIPPPPTPPPPQEIAALPPRPEPEPEAPAPPEPEPSPEPMPEKARPEKKEPEKKAEKKPEKAPEPVKKEKKKKEPEFDLDRISRNVDKLAKDKPQPQDQAALQPPSAAETTQRVGAGTSMTASEIDALRSQLAKCWNVPVGAPRPEDLIVRVKLFLNADGTVARTPELLDSGRLSGGDPYFRAAAESAIRAVHICGPYALPADKFADWQEITITFDPRKMAGL